MIMNHGGFFFFRATPKIVLFVAAALTICSVPGAARAVDNLGYSFESVPDGLDGSRRMGTESRSLRTRPERLRGTHSMRVDVVAATFVGRNEHLRHNNDRQYRHCWRSAWP